MITRTCKVLPNIVTKMRRGAVRLDFQDDILIWCRPALNGSPRHLCTSETGENIAQTKKEKRRRYDPTIKYEALRQCAVPRYAYYDDSATDWTDSDSEIEIETMTEEEAQTRKEKILAEAKEEQPFKYRPYFNYEIFKRFFYIDSPDSLAYSDLILYSQTEEERKIKKERFFSEFIGSEFDFITKTKNKAETEGKTENETKTETDTTAEDKVHKDKILAGINHEQLFRYDPSIKYEPLKRYIVPRFDFFDSSSTEWSDSSDSSIFSDSESETEIMADEAESQKGRILTGSKEKQLSLDDLVKSPLTNLQYMSEDSVKFPSKHLQSKPAVS
ncbi:hypothetical protein POM88_051555 [Heracleum sosnowskyi]|uniref:Uncharacterized protein n=1 Tax=Heracleum sosnowskyi TaxID=360622 RepID=A0AAD8H0P5_9APIA|nr:hypothetical protein POM88_051555 [Heracleum sosnowskyi]